MTRIAKHCCTIIAVLLSLICLSPMQAMAGQDPIGFSITGQIPGQTTAGVAYRLVYHFTSHLPFTMPTALNISHSQTGQGFSIHDQCSGKRLPPNHSCNFGIDFNPTQAESASAHLAMEYSNDVVPLPTVVSTVSPRTSLFVAGGIATVPFRPILWFSNAQGTWSPAIVPGVQNGGEVQDVYCDGSICVAAGDSPNNTTMLWTSFDSGKTWQKPNFTPSTPAEFFSVHRSSTNWVAVGGRTNSPGTNPGIWISSDAINWSKATINGAPLADPLLLGAVNCSGSICVAVGINLNIFAPVIYYSHVGGTSWTKSSSSFPVGGFASVDCNGSNCVAVGQLSDNKPIWFSTNGGQSWTNSTTMGGFPNSTQFSSVHCNGTSCNAVDESGKGIWHSNSSGQVWVKATTQPTVPGTTNFSQVDCGDNHCVTVGRDSSTNSPVIWTSSDKDGTTWIKVNPLGLSALTGRFFSGVHCIHNECIAVGGGNLMPAIIWGSIDSGLNWVPVNTTAPLPSISVLSNVSGSGTSHLNNNNPLALYGLVDKWGLQNRRLGKAN